MAADVPEAPSPPPPPPVVDMRPASSGLSPWTYVGFGVSAAGVITGAVFGVITINDKSNLDKTCTHGACPVGSQSSIDAMNRDGLVSDIAFGVGAVGLVVGIVAAVSSGGSHAARAAAGRPPKTRVVVHGNGVALVGAF